MIKKNILFLVVTIFFYFSTFAHSQVKVYNLDLNTDLKKEQNLKKSLLKDKVFFTFAQNETRSICFAVESSEQIDNLTIDFVIDYNKLTNNEDMKVELFYLKYWYQSGSHTVYNRSISNYVAELLVKDYSLIKVDYDNKINYLKIVDEYNNEKYVEITSKDALFDKKWKINDAKNLSRLSLSKNAQLNIFSDIKIGKNVLPGFYKANFNIYSNDKIIHTVPIVINILDIALGEPVSSTAIYYRAKINTGYIQGVGSEEKSIFQYESEMQDLIDHGVQFPTIHQRFITLNLELNIRKKLNFNTQYIYYLDGTGKPSSKSDYKSLAKRVKRIVKISRHYGYENIHIHGIDEARGDILTSERRAFEVVQSSGGKVFKACYDDALALVGDLLDTPILYAPNNENQTPMWKSKGKRVYAYGNPQVGIEDYSLNRRQFGFYLFANGFDGSMPYAYQHGFNNIWNDYDHEFRDHNFTYPLTNGLVSTVQWKGYREGVNDLRYVKYLIDNKNYDADKLKIEILEMLKNDESCDAIRSLLIKKILT